MDLKDDPGYSLDASFLTALADAARTMDKSEATFVDARLAEQFSTANTQPEGDASGVFPESPWHLVVLIVALLGVLVDFLSSVE